MNMDRQQRKTVHVSFKQKKKLLEIITKHPLLIAGRVTQDFSYIDAQRLWQEITRELNSIPGAKKTWKQWRKTWQDLRCKTKKQQETLNGAVPTSVIMFTTAEQEALGIKNAGSAPIEQETTEFVPLETDSLHVNNILVELEGESLVSEPESPPEAKVFTRSYKTKIKNHNSSSSKHSNACSLKCDLLAVHEKRKLQLKEEFINYKKDYLRKKLKLMKEQTEALKTIARELCEQ